MIQNKLISTLQNKGKESENSYQKLKRSLKDRHTKTVSRYFDRHGRLYQSKERMFVNTQQRWHH